MEEDPRYAALHAARSTARGVVTRHVNAVTKIIDAGAPSKDWNAWKKKVTDARDRYEAAFRELETLYGEFEADVADLEEAWQLVTTEVNSVLEAIDSAAAKPDHVEDETPGDQRGGAEPSEMSPASLKLVRVLQCVMSQSNTQREAAELKAQEERHQLEKEKLQRQIDALTARLDVTTYGQGSSTPRPTARRLTPFGVGLSAIPEDDHVGVPAVSRLPPGAGVTSVNEPRGRVQDGVYARTVDPGFEDSSLLMQRQLMEQSQAQHRSLLATMKAPALTIPRFSGDPLEYTMFMHTFDELVDSVLEHPRAKLSSLLSYCDGKARAVVSGCMHHGAEEGYKNARSKLKQKFGSPFLISQAWMTKLQAYPILKSPEQLDQFATDLVGCRDSLLSLGYGAELEATGTIQSLVAKLPFAFRTKWRRTHRQLVAEGSRGLLDKLVELVQEAAEEATDPVFSEAAISKLRPQVDRQSGSASGYHRAPQSRRGQVHCLEEEWLEDDQNEESQAEQEEGEGVYAIGRKATTCKSCGSSHHFTSRCHKYKEMAPQARLAFVKEKGLCLVCLSDGHSRGACPLPWKCQDKSCGEKHHTSLHQAFVVEALEQDMSDAREESVNMVDTSLYLSRTVPCLPLAPVILRNGSKTMVSYALIDNGSTLTLCHTRVIKELGLLKKGKTRLSVNTVNGRSGLEGGIVDLEAASANDGEFYPVEGAVEVQQLPVSLEHLASASQLVKWDHLKDLNLKDINCNRVDLLIGQNNHHLLEPKAKRVGLDRRDPYAVLTPLGWTIYGGVAPRSPETSYFVGWASSVPELRPGEQYSSEGGSNIHGDVVTRMHRFWEVEEVPEAPLHTADEQKVLDLWESQWRVTSEGFIELPIPFKREPPGLENNYSMALRSLLTLGRRLRKNPEEKELCCKAMLDNITEGFAEEVTDETEVDERYINYLITHFVSHPRKPGVRRMVKNASAKFKGVSLNDVTYIGPDLLNKLVQVLTRFRRFKKATTGDIKGMFNMVKVPVGQRDALRILFWRNGDLDGEIVTYRMTTHMFGAGWAPAAATFALRKTLEIDPTPSERVARSVIDDFYVDDWLSSEHTEEESSAMVRDVRDTVARGGFALGKFGSNDRRVLSKIEAQRRAKELVNLDLSADRLPCTVTLGSGWDPEDDKFSVTLRHESKPFTRRGLMSYVAALYDPLGLLTPVTLPAKLLMRESCITGESWDANLPDSLGDQWRKWLEELPRIESFSVPRWIGCAPDSVYNLHSFGDACELAYGGCVYLLVMDHNGDFNCCHLIAGKSRLAPKCRRTTPRLEMCAAVLAVRLGQAVEGFIGLVISAMFYWSDSSIVLRMFMGDPAAYKPFMGNRIAFVQRHTDVRQWNHVPGKDNPADLASRGLPASELIRNKLWINGPDFLSKPREDWPKKVVSETLDVVADERKRSPDVYVLHASSAPSATADMFRRFLSLRSSLTAMKTLMAWLIRLTRYYMKVPHGVGSVTAEEFGVAELALARLNQRCYLDESQRKSKGFQKMFPVDDTGLWVVGGRLAEARLGDRTRHPAILPRGCPMATQVIEAAHLRSAHGGVERTLAEVRTSYWLLSGRDAVKKVVGRCIMCKRLNSAGQQQLMADLPSDRVDYGKPPFANSGVDLFGPLTVVVYRRQEKRYGALFTCLVTRAVHLEVVASLSTDDFLSAMSRFTARRGKPEVVRSDNGTNFVGARCVMAGVKKLVGEPEIQKRLAEQGVTWVLNSPTSSHQGGVWERLIRSARKILNATLGGQSMTLERLQTAMCMAEEVLNSRPLTKLTDDPEMIDPLTPAHLLIQRSLKPLLRPEFTRERLLKDWGQAESLAAAFWRRWLRHYLPELQARKKWFKESEEIKKGQLVLMIDDQRSRMDWPLGVIDEVYPGRDGRVRSVQIRTRDGRYRRTIAKVILLEADVG